MSDTTTVTGEKSFSTKGREVKKTAFQPLPAGDYELRLRSDKAEVRKGQNWDSLPYVAVYFEALNTAETDGGKNKGIYHNFFTGLTPGKDGIANTDRPSQIVAFARACGLDFDASIVEREAANPDTGETRLLECLNPQALLQWLKANDGQVVKAHTKVRQQKGFEPKAEIAYFEVGSSEDVFS